MDEHTMAPPSIDEPLDLPVPQEPSSPPIDTRNHYDSETANEEKVVSVGEILYGVESFHAIIKPGKSDRVKDALISLTIESNGDYPSFYHPENSPYYHGTSRAGYCLH
jgi:hypothetical protein